MKDKICATLTKDHIYICDGGVIGRSGENECTQLEITLDECLCDKWVYIDFIKPDGTTYKTPKLDIVNNKVIYDIPNSLLDQKGTLKVQVVLQNEEGEIWKSNIKTYGVNPSINATDDIPNQDDFITEAQKIVDEASELNEDYKTNIEPEILGAIEKSETAISISKGANQSLSYGNYETMVTAFNNLPIDIYRVGQNILIVTLNVPDLWISAIEEEYTPYIYVDDDTFTNELKTNGTVKVGFYVLSALETQKVDLTDYIKNTDYVTNNKAGIVRTLSGYGVIVINPSTGLIGIQPAAENDIDEKTNNYKPIVPSKLEYAVKSVVGGHTTLTQAEYDALETKDENTYYYIVEE